MNHSLCELIKGGFGVAEDYNCAEKIVRGADIAYGLGLSEDAMRMAGGFGGGMGLGETCGTVTGAVAVISGMLVKQSAHTTPELKPSTQSFINQFRERLGEEIECRYLRKKYRTKEEGCNKIVIVAAELLDELANGLQEEK
ncbi:MAG: C-GCAxxG-C-C family protein, partial [Firmicutes bacterium]|nr:C-GCAxxG-C-C family protein [Bacillota bacterium]